MSLNFANNDNAIQVALLKEQRRQESALWSLHSGFSSLDLGVWSLELEVRFYSVFGIHNSEFWLLTPQTLARQFFLHLSCVQVRNFRNY